jgi:hypothetical protein
MSQYFSISLIRRLRFLELSSSSLRDVTFRYTLSYRLSTTPKSTPYIIILHKAWVRVKQSFYVKIINNSRILKNVIEKYNAKVGREDIFKPTIGNESFHEISSDNGVTVVNSATSKNLTVKSTIFSHRNIHKFTWTSLDGRTHNTTDHILTDRRRYSSILDVRFFRAEDCDTDHYLVVAEFTGRDWQRVNKQRTKFIDIGGGY